MSPACWRILISGFYLREREIDYRCTSDLARIGYGYDLRATMRLPSLVYEAIDVRLTLPGGPPVDLFSSVYRQRQAGSGPLSVSR